MGNFSGSHNPFPPYVDSTWQFEWTFNNSEPRTDFPLKKSVVDSIYKFIPTSSNNDSNASEKYVKVIARRNFKSVEEMDTSFNYEDSNIGKNMKIKHRLNIQFRWFYTYFTYRETYPMIKTGFELPIVNFMTKDEASFWFTGQPNILQGMNGLEMREYLGEIEEKYAEWLTKNMWNSEYKVILSNYDSLSKKPVSKEQFKSLQDSIYGSKIMNMMGLIQMEESLNSFFKTNVFSELWKNKNSPLPKYEESNLNSLYDCLSVRYNSKLVMPGKIIQTGNAVIKDGALIWKISYQRSIPADYVIEAQSRKANVWAFILTGIILIIAVGSFIWKPKR